MKLELATFSVKDVRFSSQTSYSNGVLELNKEELVALVLEDKKVASADLDVAFPNEQTRIANVSNAVEPRVKVSGPGCVFPGILGPIETVGEGRTHRLSGVTVMSSAQYPLTIHDSTLAARFSIVDMWKPGAQLTPFGSTINIVLILKLVDDVTERDASVIIQSSQLNIAQRLAETTRERTPENVEVFELGEVEPSLPKLIYILGAKAIMEDPYPQVAFYGEHIKESLPTFIHPNEIIDGVLAADPRRGCGADPSTWEWMSLPIVLELLKEHGKRVNFLGVILQRTRFLTERGKLRSAVCSSQMARLLGADGIIITTSTNSGNTFMDVMFTIQACERKGIKTVLLTHEWRRSETEIPLPFYVPEVTAMVSSGDFNREVKLPVPAKVIGVEKGQLVRLREGMMIDPWKESTISRMHFAGGFDWHGFMNHTCEEY